MHHSYKQSCTLWGREVENGNQVEQTGSAESSCKILCRKFCALDSWNDIIIHRSHDCFCIFVHSNNGFVTNNSTFVFRLDDRRIDQVCIMKKTNETDYGDVTKPVSQFVGECLIFAGIGWLLGHEVFAVALIYFGIRCIVFGYRWKGGENK
jgi:hypothetical protein